MQILIGLKPVGLSIYLWIDPILNCFFIRDFVVVKDLAIEDEHFQKKLELLTGENKKKNTHLVNF